MLFQHLPILSQRIKRSEAAFPAVRRLPDPGLVRFRYSSLQTTTVEYLVRRLRCAACFTARGISAVYLAGQTLSALPLSRQSLIYRAA